MKFEFGAGMNELLKVSTQKSPNLWKFSKIRLDERSKINLISVRHLQGSLPLVCHDEVPSSAYGGLSIDYGRLLISYRSWQNSNEEENYGNPATVILSNLQLISF